MAFRIRSLLLYIVIFVSNEVPLYAQKEPPPPTMATSTPPPGLQLPIDDHLWVLLLMGLILGIYFLKKRNVKLSTP